MSHFYGVLKGSRGEVTRCGAKSSGLSTTAASWSGAIRTEVYYDKDLDCNMFRVYETTWQGAGKNRLVAEGKLGA